MIPITMRIGLLAACAVLCQASLPAQQIAERNPEYRVHRSDVLDVKYRYTPEFDQTVNVGPDGRVSLTEAGSFVAAGLTVEQFRQKVVELSSARLVKPEISVVLKEFDKPHVMIEGEVGTPGRVDLRGDLSVLDAIAMAGGFKNTSSQSKVLLLREDDGKPGSTRVLNLKKVVAENKLEEAVELRPGDVIYVTQNKLSKVERLAHLGQFGAIYTPVR